MILSLPNIYSYRYCIPPYQPPRKANSVFLCVSLCLSTLVIYHLFIEEKPVPAKMDEFTEKVQTAFDPTPPPPRFGIFHCKLQTRSSQGLQLGSGLGRAPRPLLFLLHESRIYWLTFTYLHLAGELFPLCQRG